MDIKDAAKTVESQLNKVRKEVESWHLQRDVIFNSLVKVVQKEHDKALEVLQDRLTSKDVLADLKAYENVIGKTVTHAIKQLFDVSVEHSNNVNLLSKDLGSLANPYLKSIKDFGIGFYAKSIIENEVINFINSEAFKEFKVENLNSKLNKKMKDVTKTFEKTTVTEAEHLQYMAKVELFGTTLLKTIDSPLQFSKSSQSWIDSDPLLSSLVHELKCNKSVNKIDQALNDVKLLHESVHLDTLAQSYGVSPDEDSLKRSKSAMQGVKESVAYFKRDFKESLLEDISHGNLGMNKMFLNDMMDHLNLGKACLVNNAALMNKCYSMDTASRELMPNSLYEYLNSGKFFDEVSTQKKKKIKP